MATADQNFFQMIQAMAVKNTISSNENNGGEEKDVATATNNSMIPQNLMRKRTPN